MYLEDFCTIKKTDDGKFVVQVMKKKPAEKEEKKSDCGCVGSESRMEEKTYVANSVKELCALIEEHANYADTDDKKFSKAFKKGK